MALEQHAGPVAAGRFIHQFKDFTQTGNIGFVITDQHRIGFGNIRHPTGFGEEVAKLIHGIPGYHILHGTADHTATAAAVRSTHAGLALHGDLCLKHDLDHLAGFNGTATGQTQHVIKIFPQFTLGHTGIDVQRNIHPDIRITGEVEPQNVCKSRQGIHQRRAVKGKFHIQFFIRIQHDKIFIETGCDLAFCLFRSGNRLPHKDFLALGSDLFFSGLNRRGYDLTGGIFVLLHKILLTVPVNKIKFIHRRFNRFPAVPFQRFDHAAPGHTPCHQNGTEYIDRFPGSPLTGDLQKHSGLLQLYIQ